MNNYNYEQGILAYFLNVGLEEPIREVVEAISNDYVLKQDNLMSKIMNDLKVTQTSDIVIAGRIQAGSTTGEKLNLFVIYGAYKVSDSTWNGYIAIINAFNNEYQLITNYASGTVFKPIKEMGQNDDGRYTLIENRDNTLAGDSYRFVILNNITAKLPTMNEYSVELRQAYNLPSSVVGIYSYDNDTYEKSIYKSPNSGTYLFRIDETTDHHQISILLMTLKIEAGQSPEWNTYYSDGGFSYGCQMLSYLPIWDSNDNLTVTIGGIGDRDEGNVNNEYYFVTKLQNGTFTKQFENLIGTDVEKTVEYATILSETRSILCYSYVSGENRVTRINAYNNGVKDEIQYSTAISDEPEYFSTQKVDNECLIVKYTKLDSTTINGTIQLYRIDSDDRLQHIYYLDNVPLDLTYTAYKLLMVIKTYNLYQWNFSDKSNTYVGYEIYNTLNYNGEPYYGKLCVSPHSSILYGNISNKNLPIFARNLYNKTINGANTTSTLQVPNQMLNDLTINIEDLISHTNLRCATFNTKINKNIYETLNVNFNGTLSMSNQNDTENIINNETGAIYLNQNASSDNQDNYDKIYLNKVRIKYADGIEKIITLENSSKSLASQGEAKAIITFSFTLDKKASTIELISNDESVVYCTYDASDLAINKTYTYTQEVVCVSN